MKHTIALTLAVLLASSAQLLAQTYSANAVGYVNRALEDGYNLLNNPLSIGENKVSEVYPSVPDGTQLVTFSPATGYSVITFDGGEWLPNGDATLPPGRGHWLRVPRVTVVTYIGEVRQGILNTPLVAGFNLVGSQVPQEGEITKDLWFGPDEGDQVLQYSPARGYTTFTFDGGEWLPTQPYLAPAEGVWIRRSAVGAWQRQFFVSP